MRGAWYPRKTPGYMGLGKGSRRSYAHAPPKFSLRIYHTCAGYRLAEHVRPVTSVNCKIMSSGGLKAGAAFGLACSRVYMPGYLKLVPFIWVAVKELKLSYSFGETSLFTIYTHYGNLISSSLNPHIPPVSISFSILFSI